MYDFIVANDNQNEDGGLIKNPAASRFSRNTTLAKQGRKQSINNEETAIKFLEKMRGRGVFQPEKMLGKCLTQFESKSKTTSIKTLSTLKDNWANIVGEKLSNVCAPEAIKGKTLVLRAIGAATPLLQMRSKEILGLAALACGVNLSKLSFIQAKPEKKNQIRAFAPLDAEKSAIIEKKIENIGSERLKNAIRMLNVAIDNLPK